MGLNHWKYSDMTDAECDERYLASCCDCQVRQAKLDDIKEFLEGIIEACYSNEPLSDFLFEDWLEEAAHRVGLKIPSTKPLNIERRNETLRSISHILQKMS